MIKVDTHFHTNFFFPSEKLTAKRAKAIWKQWAKMNFGAVILTEHAFKSPVKSYLKLMKYRPKDAKTHVFPGVECVAKKGIDMIVFSRDTYVYEQKDVMKPYCMPVEDLMDRVKKDDKLYGVVTHPYILSDTGLSFHFDDEYIKKAVKKVNILEKHNSTLAPLKKAVKFLFLHKIWKSLYKRLEKIEDVPDEFIFDDTVVFGGSDAHYPRDIGPHLKISGSAKSYDEVFDLLVSGKGERKFVYEAPNSFSVPMYMLYNGLTTLGETIKKRGHIWRTDHLGRYE